MEDKADSEDFKAEDFKAKARNRRRRATHGRTRSALSITKLAAGPQTTRLRKESNLKYSTSRSITTRESRQTILRS